ncbi:MAG: carbohydrate kinase [Clostridia bacterium]|nr:carbohydrate kinase [Clostridia bacterium]MBN2883426.1 carbohydrate kinase [Clostridia bacterium]
MTEERIRELFKKFRELRIAVVSDFVLDKYLRIDTRLNEPSLETPHDAYQVVKTRQYPGAGGTIANNLCELGVGEVYPVTFIGNDGNGFELRCEMKARGMKFDYVIDTDEMITPSYVKPMMWDGKGEEVESNRLDIKNFKNTPEVLESKLLETLDDVFEKMDAVIILDQMVESNCGVITDRIRDKLIRLAAKHTDKIIYADSRSKIHMFKMMSIKCNNYEACRAFYPELNSEPEDEMVQECGNRLYKQNGRPTFVTMGKNGIMTFGEKGVVVVPTEDVPRPYDICGAGDSVSASVVSSLAAGADEVEAAFIGNMVAAVTIRKIGVTGTASLEEVIDTFNGWFRETTPWQK